MGLESLLTGRLLADRYRIEEVIGRGGMGAVYRATDERLGRRVAVKVITLAGADEPDTRERLRQRFLREARAAAALPHHANVVPVYDFGTDESLGLDFLVMELLGGEDLAALLARSGPPPVSTGIRILLGAARGVAVGHRSGLIHRDVKPGNIFLVSDEHADFQVRVLDFGIAKLINEDTLSQLTQDGRVPLSPAFASPEQLRGLSQITPASDVFSLGAVGYLVFTGQRPFSEMDRNKLSLGMPVEVPSLRRFNPAIPPIVEEVIRKALTFDAAERYPDAGTFARELEQARRGAADEPLPPYGHQPAILPAAPASPPVADDDRTEFLQDRTEFLDDRTEFLKEAPAADAAVAGAASAPELTAALGTPPPERPLPPRRRERPRGRRRGGLVMLLVFLLLAGAGAIFAIYVHEGRWTAPVAVAPPPEELPEVDIPVVEPEPVQDDLHAFVLHSEGRRHFDAGRYDSAAHYFERAVLISPGDAGFRTNYGLALLRLGDAADAARELERAARQAPDLPESHFYLAEARLILGDTTAAIQSLQTVGEVSRSASQRNAADRRLREIRAALLAPTRIPETPEPSEVDPTPPDPLPVDP